MNIKIVMTGRSYDQTSEVGDQLTLPDEARLTDLIEEINRRLGDHQLSPSCLVAVGGNHQGTISANDNPPLQDGQEVVFLQPVAGG